MTKYRIIEHRIPNRIVEFGEDKMTYFTVERKWLFFWVNPFKTKRCPGRFASKDEALRAVIDILPIEIIIMEG